MGEDDPKLNPFIKEDGFPDFSNVSVDRCLRRIGGQAIELEAEVKKGEEYIQQTAEAGNQLTLNDFFDNVLHPIENADQKLVTSWGLAKTAFHANDVVFPTKNFFSLHQRARAANVNKYKSVPIFNAVKQLKDTYANSNELTTERKRLLDMYLLEGKLCGLNVTDESGQAELAYRQSKLSQEMITYESKIFVALDHFSHTVTNYSLMQAFPAEFLQATSVDQSNPMAGPWKVTLKRNICQTFLAYCPDREQRWNLWQADCRKTSRQVISELDNSAHVEWIRDHRNRIRELLGYDNHVDIKRDRFLLNGTDKPQNIIDELRAYARPSQQREIATIGDFATKNGFPYAQLEEYDLPYYARKYNIAVCKYDEHLIEEYFPIDKVFTGLFELTEQLFGIKITERHDETITRWHKNVKYFDVFDTRKSSLRTDSSQPIGGFYLDACSNDESFVEPNGFVVPIREHCSRTSSTPLISLIFNFNRPSDGKPHTLKLNEVQVVFSRFANALQKILNESNYRELSGLINVEYVNDAVCSGVFKNLLYRSDVLKSISEHITTKDPLTDEHIKSIQAQRLTLAGYNLSTQLFRSALDLELYSTKMFWLELLRKHYAKYFVFNLDKRDSRLLSMPEIVAGNWSGCYFALVWSDMVAADIYDAFEKAMEAKGDANVVGQRFRDTFLSSGCNTDSLEQFHNFRARDPAIDALVSNLKLTKAQ